MAWSILLLGLVIVSLRKSIVFKIASPVVYHQKKYYYLSSRPKTALLSDIFVIRKILSSGKRRLRDIIYMPTVKFFECLDLEQYA